MSDGEFFELDDSDPDGDIVIGDTSSEASEGKSPPTPRPYLTT